MPKVRRGPNGPRRSLAGKSGTNKKTPMGGGKGSGSSKSSMTKGTGGFYK